MTSASSHLTSDRVNLLELKEWLRREFLSFFEDFPGKKCIIWDNQLTQPLGLIADYKVLKERGVEKMMDLRQMKPLKSKDVENLNHIFFIVKPRLELMSLISDSIHSLEKEAKTENREFHLIFVPRKSHLCEKKLKELGVYGTFHDNIKEYFLDLIPLDYDLLSIENPELYRDFFLYNDITYLFYIAKSLMTLQTLYGIIPNIYGKGKNAQIIVDQILRMRCELSKSEEPMIPSKIDNLIIIDRSMDLITPMMQQLTYEGLVDEHFGIKYTQMEIPQETSNQLNESIATTSGRQVNVVEMKKRIVILNSADSLFSEIRDKNFHAINPVLVRTAKELQQANEMKNKLNSVNEIRMFVEKTLKTYQAKKTSLENHMTLAEHLKEITTDDDFFDTLQCQNELLTGMNVDKPHGYILACIAQKHDDLIKVIRLICIHCAVNNGFKPLLFETYKREIIRSYGFKYFGLLQNIEKSGLLFTQRAQKYFNVINQSLNLLVENVNEDMPNDISYVFSGYAPLSVRFCQYLTRANWKPYAEIFGMLPGPFIESTQKVPDGVRKRRNSNSSIASTQSIDPKITLVLFIGGCTYAEISAFRYLSESENSNEFIVATTCIINGKSLINSLDDSS